MIPYSSLFLILIYWAMRPTCRRNGLGVGSSRAQAKPLGGGSQREEGRALVEDTGWRCSYREEIASARMRRPNVWEGRPGEAIAAWWEARGRRPTSVEEIRLRQSCWQSIRWWLVGQGEGALGSGECSSRRRWVQCSRNDGMREEFGGLLLFKAWLEALLGLCFDLSPQISV